jgi:hypothetical protein
MSQTYRQHGNIIAGRMIVAVACVFVLLVDSLLFKQAQREPPQPALKGATLVSIAWLLAGAVAMCVRKVWGRTLALTILYLGSFGLFIMAVVTVATADSQLANGLKTFLISMTVYVIASLVLTHSSHVRRLTSRMFE